MQAFHWIAQRILGVWCLLCCVVVVSLLPASPALAEQDNPTGGSNQVEPKLVEPSLVEPDLIEPTTAPPRDLTTLLQALAKANYAEKATLAVEIAALPEAAVEAILKAFLKGDLYARKADARAVYVTKTDAGYRLTDAISGAELGEVGRRDVQRIGVNNALRTQLRALLASRNLAAQDPALRLRAAREMLGKVEPENRAALEAALARETDAEIRELIETALAIADLDSHDPEHVLAAIKQVRGSLRPEVRQRLVNLVEQAEEDAVRKAALSAQAGIESKLKFYSLLETTFFGLSLGSVLLLAAIGLAITFGVMGVINMAHGELIMLGAYTTYVVQLLMPQAVGWSLLVAIPAAFMVSALFGIAIERGVIRFLYGRPLETLLATFGISLILQQLVRTVFSPLNRSVSTPDWMSGSLQINAVLSITYNRLYIILFSLLVFAALLVILKRTSLGLQVRAVAQNRSMAKAMGIRTEWVDAMTFGLGSGIAGVAGVALSQLTNVGPNLGQAYIIDSFMVVVFGGVGNLWGTLVAGMSLGVVNKFLEPYSGAVLAKILVLIFIILFIQKRPRGLFPHKGRGAEG